MIIKTRFPPSPTGYLHIGSLRTALYNYLFAKKYGGIFLLRIEDTDRERYVEGAVESLIQTLDRVGLICDEGPVLVNGVLSEKGDYGPYTQSNRLDTYQKYAHQLLEQGSAYRCFCSKERLEKLRSDQQLAKLPTKYDRACLRLDSTEVQHRLNNNEPFVIRLLIPEGETTFKDEIRGMITIQNSEIDDQILLKTDGFPTYHLAVVVDDHLMGVTHIIRGEEWISSVPKHVLLYHVLNFPLPSFAHLPLILNPDKSKLSKRQGDVAVEDYLKKGYLPEALINFVALLGFNPSGDREIYTVKELIESFDLTRVNKSGAVFDITKLNWMNKQYIRSLEPKRLMDLAEPFFNEELDFSFEQKERILAVEKERLTTLQDLSQQTSVYSAIPLFEKNLLVWKKADEQDALHHLKNIEQILQDADEKFFMDQLLIEEILKKYIEINHYQNGNVLWPLRVALSGQAQSAGPFELVWVLGKSESIKRIQQAIQKIIS
ncbi:MAG: Glutamate-tRNA ligase [Candidatus Uhrbacteria bacterium GW2011_GWF2_39_13]|uniref:Glutamate--tRNA ligase n=1 Tax=Candidatus Uhrbacteria bacterium GW2011_GWF2_39_13 TaxID=1618995 RepID=A0A0G0MKT0_9BACT|nr:MAG: Glutamate-tRNA ligase [Candidatus Uhrbacteria bacterium GW2011_GWF2_39_13]HAU66598.1 glutamate--tRNA ligase [Candidatus Uhrbacteria bacterium]